MNLLLVDDDERLVVTLSSDLRWKQLGIDQIWTAYNISEACALIKAHEPEIVISDIDMPMGSGISLLSWVREYSWPCEFIFLTNFERFEFVKSAMEYRACDYITKPATWEKVSGAVIKAMDRYTRDVDYEKMGNHMVRRYPFNKERDIRSLLFSGKTECTIFADLFSIICIHVHEKEKAKSDVRTLHEIRTLMSQCFCLNEEDSIVESVMEGKCLYWALVPDCMKSMLWEHAASLMTMLKLRLQLWACCYIAPSVRIGDTHRIFSQMEKRIDSEMPAEGSILFHIGERALQSSTQQLDTKALSQALVDGSKENILLIFQKLILPLQRSGMMDTITLENLRRDYIQVVHAFLHKNNIAAHVLFDDETARNISSQSMRSSFDFMRMVDILTQRVFDTVVKNNKQDTLIGKAKNYIQQHFVEDLNRDVIANALGITSDYFSRLFIREMGRSYSDYLNGLRIDRAKELLLNEAISVGEIALSVGYNNFSYFSSVFKRYTSLTPWQYRQRALGAMGD